MVGNGALEAGVRGLLAGLDDMAVDVPMAPTQVGEVVGELVAAGALGLAPVAEAIRTADLEPPPEGEDTMLVADGYAAKVLGAALQRHAAAAGAEAAKAAWEGSGESLAAFLPYEERDAAAQAAFVEKFGLQEVVAL